MSSPRSVVITGGAGYVGSHICKALSHAGYLPVTLDHLEHGHIRAVRWGPLERGDICDYEFVEGALLRHHPIGVIHCAALTNVRESLQFPDPYYNTNVQGTLVLLEAMGHCNVNNLVFSSSCATYGAVEEPKISEAHPQLPISPYGWSKLMSERIIKDFGSAYGLRYSLLRYFNAAGADAAGEIGEQHTPETHLIPLVLFAALGKIPHLRLFGEQYATPDGTAIRDYIHVTDLAAAHVKALRKLENNTPAIAVNLGSGRGYSVREIIKTAEAIIQKPIPFRAEAARAGDPAILVADIAQAKQVLGWAPRHSDLDTILRTAWNWTSKGL